MLGNGKPLTNANSHLDSHAVGGGEGTSLWDLTYTFVTCTCTPSWKTKTKKAKHTAPVSSTASAVTCDWVILNTSDQRALGELFLLVREAGGL